MLKSIAQNPFVHIAQSFNKRRPEIVTLPYKTWAHKIMAHPKWAPKKTQPSPKIYQPSAPPPPPMVYDHSLSGKSSQGNYIRKNWNISGILLNQEEIARISYVGSLVTFLYLVWFGLVFVVLKSLGIARQWSGQKLAILSIKP